MNWVIIFLSVLKILTKYLTKPPFIFKCYFTSVLQTLHYCFMKKMHKRVQCNYKYFCKISRYWSMLQYSKYMTETYIWATWYIQDLNAFRDLKCFSCSNSERWQSLLLEKTLAASLSLFVTRMCSRFVRKNCTSEILVFWHDTMSGSKFAFHIISP